MKKKYVNLINNINQVTPQTPQWGKNAVETPTVTKQSNLPHSRKKYS